MSDLARITLADVSLVGYHGYHEAEKELGQRFELDVDLFIDIEECGQTDTLTDTVNYEKVYQRVEEIVNGDRFSLIEALATDIVDSIFEEFEIEGVTLRLRKAQLPFCPNLGHVEIEVSRGDVLE
jgi:dihydroneopterin aldolase